MWFTNKIANPFVRLILHSPLHRLMSAAMLLISYRGRKSGRIYTLPVQYAQEGHTIYIIPGMPEKKTWWRNLRGGMPVQMTLRGETLSGNGRLLDPATDADEILVACGLYLKHFPGLANPYHVRMDASGTLDAADLRAAARAVKVVRVELDR